MTKAQAVAYFGSETKLAEFLVVAPAAVFAWKEIPRLRQYQLEVETHEVLKADRSPMPKRQHKRGNERRKKAPETAIPAPTANRESAPYLAAMKPFYTLTNAEIEAMGAKLGVEPRRGETWGEYRDRLLTCGR